MNASLKPIKPAALLLLLILNVQSPAALAQGTAYAYQGHLTDNGRPATGFFDFRCELFDAATGGVSVGVLTTAATGVTNGLFTVTLDFGSGIFTGPPRWLEIGVRTNGGADLTTLAPRTPLLPTPYAIFAGSAADVAHGSVVKSLNGLRDDVVLAAGANVTITPDGNSLTLAAAGAGGTGIWSVLNNNAYYTAGNVGIGTASPQSGWRLEVVGSTLLRPGGSGGDVQISTPNGETGLAIRGTNRADVRFDGSTLKLAAGTGTGTPSALNGVAITTAGKVGIGSVDPVSKLEVASGSGDLLRLIGYEPFLTLYDGNHGYARGRIQSVNGDVVIATESYLSGANPLSFINLKNTGRVGIGVASPVTSTLEVAGQNALSLIGYQPFLTLYDGNAGYARSRIQGVNGDVVIAAESYLSGANPTAFIDLKNSGDVGIGTATPAAKLDVNGTVRTRILTITGGADIAEPFEVGGDPLPAGSVVVIDPDQPGRLMRSTRAYDKRVAGIISGANGVRPGLTLEQEDVLGTGQPVALGGRVYALADASGSAIEPGDLLTTSSTPGHAMKAADDARASGAILGKAMSGLKAGQGLVLVLVSLQ